MSDIKLSVKADSRIYQAKVMPGLTKADGSVATVNILANTGEVQIKIDPKIVPWCKPGDIVFVNLAVFKAHIEEIDVPPFELINPPPLKVN